MRPISKLEMRILEISHKFKLSHISSCLTALNLIDSIYLSKKENEPFILSNGHAFLALAVVLEKTYFKDAEELWKKHGTHPNRDMKDKIWASTGSLGHGIGIGVGMALADPKTITWVLTSDGDMNEGSNWEALRIAGEQRLENLRIMCNANGTSAYGTVDVEMLDTRMQMFYPSLVVKTNLFEWPDFLQGVDGHYHILTDEQYAELKKGVLGGKTNG